MRSFLEFENERRGERNYLGLVKERQEHLKENEAK